MESKLSSLVEGLPGARFDVIPETDHFFMSGLAELGRVAREWLAAG